LQPGNNCTLTSGAEVDYIPYNEAQTNRAAHNRNHQGSGVARAFFISGVASALSRSAARLFVAQCDIAPHGESLEGLLNGSSRISGR
jgi:hypothetical protein